MHRAGLRWFPSFLPPSLPPSFPTSPALTALSFSRYLHVLPTSHRFAGSRLGGDGGRVRGGVSVATAPLRVRCCGDAPSPASDVITLPPGKAARVRKRSGAPGFRALPRLLRVGVRGHRGRPALAPWGLCGARGLCSAAGEEGGRAAKDAGRGGRGDAGQPPPPSGNPERRRDPAGPTHGGTRPPHHPNPGAPRTPTWRSRGGAPSLGAAPPRFRPAACPGRRVMTSLAGDGAVAMETPPRTRPPSPRGRLLAPL